MCWTSNHQNTYRNGPRAHFPFRPYSFNPFPAGIRPNPSGINSVWKRYRPTTKQVFVSSHPGFNPDPPRRFPAQPGRETSLVSASWKESTRHSMRGGSGSYIRHGGGCYVRHRDRRPRGERQLADPCNPFGGCFSPVRTPSSFNSFPYTMN
jgi:hypothetical protein